MNNIEGNIIRMVFRLSPTRLLQRAILPFSAGIGILIKSELFLITRNIVEI